MNKVIKIILSAIAAIVVVVGLMGGLVFVHAKAYETTALTPPSLYFIEEDLELVFMTTDLDVYEQEHEFDEFYCKVKAHGFKYKVRYSVHALSLASFTWKYQNHIMINE